MRNTLTALIGVSACLFVSNDDAIKLARSLRAALDKTASTKV
jgi:hypothetical protein